MRKTKEKGISSMTKEEIKNIVIKIVEARGSYYNTGVSIMPDSEYDALEATVAQHDPDNPILEKVGHAPSESWETGKHLIAMGSLDKVHSEEEFIKWAKKYKDQTFIMQLKLDGLSISLDYEMGIFKRALVRGDGSEGEDISANVRLMKGFRETLKTVVTEFDCVDLKHSVRAEMILDKEGFEKINLSLPEKDRYANPRNAASGICRRLDGKYCKQIQLIYYDVNVPVDEDSKLKILTSWDMPIPTPHKVGDLDTIVKAFEKFKIVRPNLSFDIDGVVVKVCSISKQLEEGSVRNRPKTQRAWKFEPPGAATIFIKEIWDVGRTGVVTPLALIEAVNIEGSTIRRVTLHNVAEIKRLGIGRGDLVMLVKAGDVIPKIIKVLEHKGSPIEIPTKCPCCQADLINDGIKLMCPNDSCARKNFNRILNWIKVTEIETFGESLAEELSLIGKLNRIIDIYRLTKQDISDLEGWGDLSAETIFKNIDVTKILNPVTFLSALGIPKISDSTAGELLKAFGSIESLMGKTVEDIVKLKGFSDISANNVVSGLIKYKDEIRELLEVITLQEKKEELGKLSGMSFVFTGAMEQPRSFYQKMVEKNGGKNLSTVTKETTYLVCNENKGSSKSVKAEQFGVKIITEKDFLDLVGEEIPKPKKTIESYSLF
jgi:DNA ligase (NAD+)